MNTDKSIVFWILVIALLVTSCQPLEPIPPTPTIPAPTVTPAPQHPIESWDGMETGWMSFSHPSKYIQSAVYDSLGYVWAVTSNRVMRWNIETLVFEDMTLKEDALGDFYEVLFHDGEIWITAEKGAALYFDAEWEVYRLDDSSVFSSFSYTGGMLWAIAQTHLNEAFLADVFYLENQTWQKLEAPSLEYEYYQYSISIGKDTLGSVWLASYGNNTLFQFDGENWIEHDGVGAVQNIYTQADGSLLFDLGYDLMIFDGEDFLKVDLPKPLNLVGKTFLPYQDVFWLQVYNAYETHAYLIKNNEFEEAAPLILTENKPEAVYGYPIGKTPSGGIFRDTLNEGLYLYDNTNWQHLVVDFNPSGIEKITGTSPIDFTPDGKLWVTEDGVPILFDGQDIERPFFWTYQYETSPCHFQDGSDIRIDSNGNLWGLRNDAQKTTICLFKKGVSTPIEYKTFFHATDIAIAPNGNIWLASVNDLVELSLDDLTKDAPLLLDIIPIDGYRSKHYNESIDIEIGPNNTVWVLGESTLSNFDGQNWLTHSVYASPRSFDINSEGNVWVGAVNKLAYIEGSNSNTYQAYSNYGIFPNTIEIGLDGTVWFLHHGTEIYQLKGDHWQFFPQNDFTPSRILSAPDGAMWFIADNKWMRYKEGE